MLERFLGCALAMLLICGVAVSCGKNGGRSDGPATGTVAGGAALHLAAEMGEADIDCAPAPDSARQTRAWDFAEPQPRWTPLQGSDRSFLLTAALEQRDDALRISTPSSSTNLRACGIRADLGGLDASDWETLIVRARTRDRFAGVTVACNLDRRDSMPDPFFFFSATGGAAPVFNDGSVQSYAIALHQHGRKKSKKLEDVAIVFAAHAEVSIDILSVTLVPRGASFLERAGVRNVSRDGMVRHSVFAHTPATLRFPVELTEGARLDLGLTATPGETIDYTVAAEKDGKRTVLLEKTVKGDAPWSQAGVDLSGIGDGEGEIVLEAASDRQGAVAIWGAPILTGASDVERPNIIFYVIDGGDADLMSLYEYERPTTPFLEELAEEAVVFTRAYSNATWTQPSTASFMTSLHHSVLGGLRRGVHSTAIPKEAVTMADHFRAGGYRTASFTSNPNAGRIIGMDQGVDVMRDLQTKHHSTSSIDLHEMFFDFRRDYPGAPYWAHFQTTDVHEPNEPEKPFAGRWVSEKERKQLGEWESKIWRTAGGAFGTTSVAGFYDLALEQAEIDRKAYFGTRRGLYDETMAHQDHALEELVARLKERGEWENTLLVLGSDHGHPAGTFARFGRGELDPQPEPWQGALFDAYATRVPLVFVWPGKIEGGRRVETPVSMIDVLPTLLDLAGLPAPDVLQGHSLAPILRGETLEAPPVILDEFRVDERTGEWIGNLEIIDGRWGASLEIGPVPEGGDASRGRHTVPAGGRWGAVHPYFADVPRLLLYDLEKDPFATRAVNEEHPELVTRYTRLLEEQWRAHQALGSRFGDAEVTPLTQEQLEQLRNLGYIR